LQRLVTSCKIRKYCNDITEILLKVALNTITPTQKKTLITPLKQKETTKIMLRYFTVM